MELTPIPTDMMERFALAKDIAKRYPVAYSDVDNGELYWGLCAAILAADKALAERDALRAEVERLKETQRKFGALQHQFMNENAKLRAALEAAPWPLEHFTSHRPVDGGYAEWYDTTRAEALRRE